MANTYATGDTAIRFYQGVAITPAMTPIYKNPGEQFNDFASLSNLTQEGCIYIDANSGYVDMANFPDNMYVYNYLSFINPQFENKRFYCSITGVKQLASDVVRVEFSVDYFQTFMFDFKMQSSHVERQHLSEPQWQRAVANPWRSDIQELTTDEGVSVNSQDELEYRDTRWEGGSSDLPYGYPGLRAYIGDSLHRVDDTEGEPAGYVRFVVYHQYQTSPTLSKSTYTAAIMKKLDDGGDSGFWTNALFMSATLSKEPGYNIGILDVDGAPDFQDRMGWVDSDSCSISVGDYVKYAQETPTSNLIDVVGFFSAPAWMVGGLNGEGINSQKAGGIVTDYNDIEGYGSVVNPKLRRSPFRYLRVVGPDGKDVELPLENFQDPSNPVFRVVGSVSTGCESYLLPVEYMGKGVNWDNGVRFSDYVKYSWTSDAFLDYVQSKNREMIISDTASAKRARNATQPSFSDTGTAGFMQALGGVYNAVKTGISNITDPEQARLDAGADTFERMEMAQAYNQSKYMDETPTLFGGDNVGGIYSHQRSAFVGQGEYRSGHLANSKYARLFDGYEVTYVTLQPYIIQGLDSMLSAYGYRCDYFALPRAYDYIRNQDEDPHFVTQNGVTFTYLKTQGAKVWGVIQPAAVAIAGMMDGGVRFTRGLQR